MPSPIGHSLAGGIIYVISVKQVAKTWKSLLGGILFCLIYSNLPDIDFLPGIIVGSLNKYHHVITHSLFFSVVLALLTGFIAGRKAGWLSFILLGIHIIMDYFTADTSFPYGMTIFWPFSNTYFISPISIFLAYKKRAEVMDIINPVNMGGYIYELFLLLPVLILVIYLKRRRVVNS